MMRYDSKFHYDLTPEKLDAIIDGARSQANGH